MVHKLIPAEYTETDYRRERAICDKASAYWVANAGYAKNGWSSLSAEKAAHPDYAACDNEMRGRVEQWGNLAQSARKALRLCRKRRTERNGLRSRIRSHIPLDGLARPETRLLHDRVKMARQFRFRIAYAPNLCLDP